MAMEHVWVKLNDGFLLRGDQIVGFGTKSRPKKKPSRSDIWGSDSESTLNVEVFGTASEDRSRKLCNETVTVVGAEGEFLAQLYTAANRASESNPQLVKTNVEARGVRWTIEEMYFAE